jgi:exodeoxyribonuclease-3
MIKICLKFFFKFNYQTISQTQKSYNGVSISYQEEFSQLKISLLELKKLQARNNIILLKQQGIAIINNYFPNGNPIDTEKFTYKIELDG